MGRAARRRQDRRHQPPHHGAEDAADQRRRADVPVVARDPLGLRRRRDFDRTGPAPAQRLRRHPLHHRHVRHAGSVRAVARRGAPVRDEEAPRRSAHADGDRGRDGAADPAGVPSRDRAVGPIGWAAAARTIGYGRSSRACAEPPKNHTRTSPYDRTAENGWSSGNPEGDNGGAPRRGRAVYRAEEPVQEVEALPGQHPELEHENDRLRQELESLRRPEGDYTQ